MTNDSRLDVIVFGATGYVVENLIRTIDKENLDLTWGVADRNDTKIREVLERVAKYVGKNLDGIPVIVADVNDEDSILRMCKQCRIIINCVGPYGLYGEVVVKNCILLIVGRWRGPEPAAASIIIVQAAIAILKEMDVVAYKGGVLTPGLAFEHTSLVERLRRHSVVFDIIK